MDPEQFDRQIETVRWCLDQMKEYTERSVLHQQEVLTVVLEELTATLEELRAAGEELRQQAEELAAARETIEAERRRYQELFEFAPDGYLVTDRYGVIQEANRAAGTLLNTPPERLIGRPLAAFVPRDERKAFRSQLGQLSHLGRVQDWEVRLQPHEEAAFAAALTVAAVRDQEGELVALRWLVRDISDRKRTEIEQQRLLRRAQAAEAELEQRVRERTAELEAANAMLRRLQTVTDAALAHLNLDDLLRELLNRIREVLQVDNVAILLLDADGQYLTLHAALGLEEAVVDQVRIPVGRGVSGRIVASGEPLVIGDLSTVEVAGPVLQEQAHSLLGVPLLVEGRAIGVIHVSTVHPRQFTEDDLQLLQLVADRVAPAIAQSRLYEAERRAHAAAEAARKRLAFLVEASAVLSASLDYEATLQNLAQVVVPNRGDYCVIDILDEKGILRRVASAHVDPLKEQVLREGLDRRPDQEPPPNIAAVLNTGEAKFFPEVTDALLQSIARDAKHLAALRALGPRSYMIVPLSAHGRVLGTLTLALAESGRRYNQEDLVLAEGVARRAALAIENARLYREAQEAVRTRDRFLAVVSHDLKNPLASIKLCIQLLQREAERGTLEAEVLREELGRIDAAAKRVTALIDELMDVVRLEMGQPLPLDPKLTDLVALVRQVVAEHQQAAAGHHLRVEAQVPELTGHWDVPRLERALSNLLRNAIKYSPEGSEVVVTVTQEADTWAVVVVQDQGIGIPPEDLPRIFEPFRRGANAAACTTGIGIGLTSTRQIVEQHGGSIEVHSEVGLGSTFTVRLPLDPPRREYAVPPGPS